VQKFTIRLKSIKKISTTAQQQEIQLPAHGQALTAYQKGH
jgi:hypothetical protein